LIYSKFEFVEFRDKGEIFEMFPHGEAWGYNSSAADVVMVESESRAMFRAAFPLIQLTVVVHNLSDELIGPAKVQVVNNGKHTTYDDFSFILGAVEPKSVERVQFVFRNDVHPGQPRSVLPSCFAMQAGNGGDATLLSLSNT
jgi:hypothetical protein